MKKEYDIAPSRGSITQAELAAELGGSWNVGAIRAIERGDCEISAEQHANIHAAIARIKARNEGAGECQQRVPVATA